MRLGVSAAIGVLWACASLMAYPIDRSEEYRAPLLYRPPLLTETWAPYVDLSLFHALVKNETFVYTAENQTEWKIMRAHNWAISGPRPTLAFDGIHLHGYAYHQQVPVGFLYEYRISHIPLQALAQLFDTTVEEYENTMQRSPFYGRLVGFFHLIPSSATQAQD
ncbi:MAG: hypothetical protein H2057_08050 [Alphaproteobacteria bacterium]|nr:hypothetical protein [Alphaproteobacteria bacterium]